LVFAALLCTFAAVSPGNAQTPGSTGVSTGQQPVVLDSVIAVINGDVLLKSDLQSEMDMAALQPLSLPEGKNFERRAAQRLINRVLILQQMRNQGMVKDVSDQDVQKDLDLLRKQLPACQRYHCETATGWAGFLADHNLTSSEVEERWRQRMQILAFIDARFRAGIRIPESDISDYYKKTLVPQFTAQHAKPPTLASVSDRIEEVLLQQHVNLLLQDWLNSLRDQGNVVILDPDLGLSNSNPDNDDGGGS
jgi:peptidyl-prolyl cis-trans isomerase SurA